MSMVIKKNISSSANVNVKPPGMVLLHPDLGLGAKVYHDVPQYAFDQGILDADFHERLLSDLDQVTEVAGIPKEMVWSRMVEYCVPDEIAWVKNMRTSKDHGLAYVGAQEKAISQKMFAVVGACLRNYIDARIMSVQEVLSRLKNDVMPQPTVLLIPNFSMIKGNGGDIPQWQVSSLLGLLYTRLARGLKTVVYIESMEELDKFYGASFRKHLDSYYTKIE